MADLVHLPGNDPKVWGEEFAPNGWAYKALVGEGLGPRAIEYVKDG